MRIDSLKTIDGMFALVEFDDVARVVDSFGFDLRDKGSRQIIDKVVSGLIQVYAGNVSGFVLEPELSLDIFLEQKVDAGLGLVLDEPRAEHDPLSLPSLIENWGVEQVRNNYGVASLTLFYHPQEELALKKKQFVAEVADYCRYEEIDLVLKLVVYTPGDRKFNWEDFRKDQMQALEEMRGLASLFVLQYPNDSLSCATITTQLDVPWVVSDDNLEYSDFKEKLRDSMENGASGFLAGESLFKEIEGMRREDQSPDLNKILEFITKQSRDRIIELSRIVGEFN